MSIEIHIYILSIYLNLFYLNYNYLRLHNWQKCNVYLDYFF